MPPRPHSFGRLDALERRYDGPVPPADPALAALPPAGARARLFERLAGDDRAAIAVRRARLVAKDAVTDRRLDALGRSLAVNRAHCLGWR
ncbi:MAG: hypothetical protein AB1918_04355 [Pseudomonadota bacterium]